MVNVKLLVPAIVSAPLPDITPAKLSLVVGATVNVLLLLMTMLAPVFVPLKSVMLKVFSAFNVPLSITAPVIAPDTLKVAPVLIVVPPV